MNSRKSAKTLVIAASLLALVAQACSFSIGTTKATDTKGPDLAGTQAALGATQDALNAAATAAAAQPPTTAPTQAPAVVPTATTYTSPDFYTEEFDFSPPDWTYVTYTGQSNPNAGSNFDVSVENGSLVFDIPDENVWIYYGPDSWTYTDVRIDTRATNKGNNNNNVTLFCRYNDRGWYEANVANNGLYNMYRYEASSDQYFELYSGGVQNLKTGKATNDFTLVCKGNEITLGVNGTEIRTVKDNIFDEGLIGVGVSSFTGVPVLVEFEYVSISQP